MACAEFPVQASLENLVSLMNREAYDEALRMIASPSDGFILFADLLIDRGSDESIDFTDRASALPQMRQLAVLGAEYSVTNAVSVGEQNSPGVLDFNFELVRTFENSTQPSRGKGSIDCASGLFVLLTFGVGAP